MIVHAHVGLPDGVAAIAIAERLGVPLVTTEHDSSATARLALPGMREAYLPLLQEGRALLAVSQSLRNRLAIALEVDPARNGVVPNVVDVDAFASGLDTARREAGELLWVGGRKAGKGIDVLLAAFARLQASRPDLRLRLIGRAPSETEEARCRALARDLGIAGAVAFEGDASRPRSPLRWPVPPCSSIRARWRRSGWWQQRRWRPACPWPPHHRAGWKRSLAMTAGSG